MKKRNSASFSWLSAQTYRPWILGLTALLGMGITMPSCPGQQAMQQQIDNLQTANQDLSKKVQLLNTQLNAIANDMNQVKHSSLR